MTISGQGSVPIRETLSSERELVVACGSDEGYAVHMLVMLRTLLKAHHDAVTFRVYIMDGGIHPQTRVRFDRLLAREKRLSYEWLNVDFEELSGLMSDSWIPHLSSAALMRLLLPELLPKTVEKLLYIDSDVIVEKDVCSFYDMPFRGKHLIGVQDFNQPSLAYIAAKESSVPATAPTFNSGILMMNLTRFRETGYMKRVTEAMRRQPTWSDQEGLNAILFDEWILASFIYNMQSSGMNPTTVPESSLKEEMMGWGVDRLRSEAVMLHFTGDRKPWAGRWRHPHRERYEALLYESGWFSEAQWLSWKTKRMGSAATYWLQHRLQGQKN
ncbi:MAG: hypothetical protein H7145_17290 [Akkermansiaceae bacterium]|nr:hypothetical protein [Armatimonadota bacterium]